MQKYLKLILHINLDSAQTWYPIISNLNALDAIEKKYGKKWFANILNEWLSLEVHTHAADVNCEIQGL